MPQVINTNIMSLNAQRNLNSSQDALQVSLQRLSSGLRINSAKDDAAGLAISERFTSQIRGLNQAVLTGCRVEHQQHFVRRAGCFPPGHPGHLFEFRHQVLFRVKASGGIEDDVVDVARLCRTQRVVKHGGGPAL